MSGPNGVSGPGLTFVGVANEAAVEIRCAEYLCQLAGDLEQVGRRDIGSVRKTRRWVWMSGDGMQEEFAFDVRRAVLLGAYIRSWGMPDSRVEGRRGHEKVEVYSFPPRGGARVHRFATVGVSALFREGGGGTGYELFVVLPESLTGMSVDAVSHVIMDVMAYSLRQAVVFSVGSTIPEVRTFPPHWLTRALLVDEPRGEAEELSRTHLGTEHVRLLWLVPLHQREESLVRLEGVEAFDERFDASDWSLADPMRGSVV